MLTRVKWKFRFELYLDNGVEWRWRLVSRNGNTVADSGQGYTSKATARTAARRLTIQAAEAVFVDL